MKLPESEVKRIAHLARLEVAEQDLSAYGDDLGRILELFDSLAAVDLERIEPMAHPMELTQRLRPDEVTEVVHREELAALAPEVRDGLYVVPKVIE